MDDYKEINKLISSEGGHLKINKLFIKKFGIEAAVLFSELLQKQIEAINNEKIEFLCNQNFFVSTVENIQIDLGLSAHKQRLLLNILQENNLLKVYYTSNNVRMITINDDLYHIYKILKPSEDFYPQLFENVSKGVKRFVDFMVKNWDIIQKEKINSFNNDYESYFEKELSNHSSILEKRVFELLKDTEIKKEVEQRKLICNK